MHDSRIMPIAHDATLFNIGCQQISWPHDPVFGPCLFAVASQSMNEDDAESDSYYPTFEAERYHTQVQPSRESAIPINRISTYCGATEDGD